MLFAVAICASRLEAQEDRRDDKPAQSVEQLIEDLGSDSFAVRRAAREALKKSGQAAIPDLRRLESTSTLDVKAQIQAILRLLDRESFGGRLTQLQKTLKADLTGNRLSCIFGC
jgi:HEAT repeat protein